MPGPKECLSLYVLAMSSSKLPRPAEKITNHVTSGSKLFLAVFSIRERHLNQPLYLFPTFTLFYIVPLIDVHF
jgi:hypothetical protein